MTQLPALRVLLACTVLSSASALAQGGDDGAALIDFSLEQLSDIVVTSVVRQETRLADAPAALYVISAADIRRSGAATLPEVLRLAPNLQVAQADTRNYAISARGYGNTLANKLLVLIDGRSIYSPLFSGVFWDIQDVMLDDVERIEIISGPGATIWGANAVNGVINIITRAARDTQGNLLSAEAGQRGPAAALRHGGRLASGAHYRVYGKHQRLNDTVRDDGRADGSGMRRDQAGFRIDWEQGRDTLTLSGDAYLADLGQPLEARVDSKGVNLLARLTRHLDGGQQLRLQAYLDHTDRQQRGGGGGDRLDTVDLEIQHGLRLGANHDVVWGGGYRQARDRVTQGPVFQFLPTRQDLRWANLFAQDEISLRPDLHLTLGLKLEHNNYTGLEALPNLRLAWHAGAGSLLWGALSRTVRAPARIDRDLHVPFGAGGPFSIDGGPHVASETARVLELGYRRQHGTSLSYAASAYIARYDRLRTLEPVGPASVQFQNRAEGLARGIELWGRWQAQAGWRLDAGLVVQDIDTRPLAGSLDLTTLTGLGSNDPHHYWSLRSAHELGHGLQLDIGLRRVGALPQPAVPAYSELDARLLWRARPDLDLALAGVNLLHARHLEFRPAGVRQLAERALQLQLVLRF